DAAGGITVLNLRGMRPGVTHEITLNGRPVPDPGNRPLRLESNPGTIQLEVGIPGNTNVFTWSGQASAGESLRVRIQIDEATSDGPGVLESPWFWVAVGGVALAGAGVGLYFALDSAADLEPNNKGFHITLTD
ncbi:MAG: hypothetical protein KC416_00395, partial [Myxococcales bacterium]|nr:hypothetical protein [Myxococcales bacterium]